MISGEGEQMVEDEEGEPVTQKVGPGCTIFVPESRFHSTLNTGNGPMQLFVVYSPAGPEAAARAAGFPAAPERQVTASFPLPSHTARPYSCHGGAGSAQEAEMDQVLSRRLAAVLCADVAGYSALIGADEAGAVAALRGHQTAVLQLLQRHGGRVVNLAGDGLVAEFPSTVAAVEAALGMQALMAERNANVPAGKRMVFRIGINQGDVVHDDTHIYGDGINIAARLQSIAEPGGVYVSGKVYDEVRDRMKASFLDLGERELKNITRPVRVFEVSVAGQAAAVAAAGRGDRGAAPAVGRRAARSTT